MTQPHPAIAARRRRVHRIRTCVAAGAVALFIALFSGLYVQMASGHDPALANQTAQASQATTSSSSGGTTSSSSSSSGGTTSSSSGGSSSSDAAPMTTSAS